MVVARQTSAKCYLLGSATSRYARRTKVELWSKLSDRDKRLSIDNIEHMRQLFVGDHFWAPKAGSVGGTLLRGVALDNAIDRALRNRVFRNQDAPTRARVVFRDSVCPFLRRTRLSGSLW